MTITGPLPNMIFAGRLKSGEKNKTKMYIVLTKYVFYGFLRPLILEMCMGFCPLPTESLDKLACLSSVQLTYIQLTAVSQSLNQSHPLARLHILKSTLH